MQQPGQNEDAPVPGDAADGRGDSEQPDPDDEGALAADSVTQAAAQQHQATKGQHVGGDHPAAPGIRQAQLVLDLGSA